MIDSFDLFQICLVILISFLLANYLYAKWSLKDRRRTEIADEDVEGFSNPSGSKETAENEAGLTVLGNEHLFDAFYAKIYDKIVDGDVRQEAETTLTLNWVKQYRPELSSVLALDVGCGTGGQVELFQKAGLGKVVGIDASDAMIARGRSQHPKADLRVGDAGIIGTFAAGEFNLITLYYFTFYYLRDRGVAVKNMFSWLQPGGLFIVHVVNRDKFDPILESASPFVAFSVQKYAKERVTRSRVSFDKFDYEANFVLEGSQGQFQETFKFKDGKRRKQTHLLRMPTMAEIVSEIEGYGFKYKQYIDMTGVGYEYQYLFCFSR